MKRFKVYQIHSSTGTELAGFEFESENMETAQASAVKIARNDHGWFGYTNKRGSRTWTPTATEGKFYNQVDCETIYIKEIENDSTPNPEGNPNVPSNNEETTTMIDFTEGTKVKYENGTTGIVDGITLIHGRLHLLVDVGNEIKTWAINKTEKDPTMKNVELSEIDLSRDFKGVVQVVDDVKRTLHVIGGAIADNFQSFIVVRNNEGIIEYVPTYKIIDCFNEADLDEMAKFPINSKVRCNMPGENATVVGYYKLNKTLYLKVDNGLGIGSWDTKGVEIVENNSDDNSVSNEVFENMRNAKPDGNEAISLIPNIDEINWANLEAKPVKIDNVNESNNEIKIITIADMKYATDRSAKDGAYYYALIDPTYKVLNTDGYILKVSRKKPDLVKWNDQIASANYELKLQEIQEKGYNIRKNTAVSENENSFWVITPQSGTGNEELGPYPTFEDALNDAQIAIKADQKHRQEEKAEDNQKAKQAAKEESELAKPEVKIKSNTAKHTSVKTDSKPKTTDKNVARKDGKVVGNLEELTDKVLKAKRENPKLSWVKLINSLQLLRQDGYKIRRSSYFQNQLIENEKNWALKPATKHAK